MSALIVLPERVATASPRATAICFRSYHSRQSRAVTTSVAVVSFRCLAGDHRDALIDIVDGAVADHGLRLALHDDVAVRLDPEDLGIAASLRAQPARQPGIRLGLDRAWRRPSPGNARSACRPAPRCCRVPRRHCRGRYRPAGPAATRSRNRPGSGSARHRLRISAGHPDLGQAPEGATTSEQNSASRPKAVRPILRRRAVRLSAHLRRCLPGRAAGMRLRAGGGFGRRLPRDGLPSATGAAGFASASTCEAAAATGAGRDGGALFAAVLLAPFSSISDLPVKMIVSPLSMIRNPCALMSPAGPCPATGSLPSAAFWRR